MADQDKGNPEKKDPPKIKLPGLQHMADDAAHAPGEGIAPQHPSGMRTEATPASGKTTRIEMSQARALGDPSDPESARTMRIVVPQAQPGAPEAPVKKQTTRIPLSEAVKPRSPDEALARKSQTTRIDLAQAKPPSAVAPETGIREGLPKEVDDVLKRRTMRIDVTGAPRVESSPLIDTVIPDAAKNVTQRIVLEDDAIAPRKGDTSRVETQPIRDAASPQEAKKRTSRIDLSDATTRINQDVLQRRVPAAPEAAPPVTAPIVEPPAARPKTIRITKPQVSAPPGPSVPDVPAPEVMPAARRDIEEAKKSETARLDLPPETMERPATRPKTIRIKRPEAVTGRKALSVSRVLEPAVAPAPQEIPVAGAEDDAPGTLFAVLAIAATLLAMVLLYVLAAQMSSIGAANYDLPSWPFPGQQPG